MMRVLAWIFYGWCGVVATWGQAQPAAEAARVIVVANATDPESVALARYYAERRAIPAENIIALPLSSAESITWGEFVRTLFNPLQRELVERGWIDGIGMELTDEAGRRRYAMSGHRIDYLVTCRGVPLKILRDNALDQAAAARQPPPFRSTGAAVDAELALLAQSGTQIAAGVPNPLFRREAPSRLELAQVVRVARLDGPSAAAARSLVDSALEGERWGLIGRAYVDVTGPHRQGNEWLEATAKVLLEAGWDPAVRRRDGTMPATARADAAVLYFGWYAGSVNGPFALPGYSFVPGAIALHIHSFSAVTVRSDTRGWAGPLAARGVAATFGNVEEPYLELTHRPELLVRALLAGATLGEATYRALPMLSWNPIMLGDPLYRPFRVGPAVQWERRAEAPPRLAPYLVLRRMRELEADGQVEEALRLARDAMRETPSLALGLALAERLEKARDKRGAAQALGVFRHVRRVGATEWALLAEGARRLDELGEPAEALVVWQNLFALDLPKPQRLVWLREARPLATKLRRTELAGQWDREIAELTPLPPEAKK